MNPNGWNFVVKSIRGRTTDWDWCGSIASAIRHLERREASGDYAEVYIQRMRVTKCRNRGSRRFLYASHPVMVRRCLAVRKVAA